MQITFGDLRELRILSKLQCNSVKPIIRWAGGKSRIVNELLNLAPNQYCRYFEPMLGSGALFFGLEPRLAYLSDSNPELVTFYECLKFRCEELIDALTAVGSDRHTFLALRRQEPTDQLARACRFAVLTRLCWNGLYRVNKDGKFNTPYGGRGPSILYDQDKLRLASHLLSTVEIQCHDYKCIFDDLREGDFLFLDPPYHKGARDGLGFNRYTDAFFTERDHRLLAEFVRQASAGGVQIMITTANDDRLTKLFGPGFTRTDLVTPCLIGKASARRLSSESVIINYSIKASAQKQ